MNDALENALLPIVDQLLDYLGLVVLSGLNLGSRLRMGLGFDIGLGVRFNTMCILFIYGLHSHL